MNRDIYLSNSLGGKKEKFKPINPKKVRMYVCGPTVYDDPHIGNARPLVVFDILFKILKCKFGNSSVVYVRNITDVDDKIIHRANHEGRDWRELVETEIGFVRAHEQRLNLIQPDHEPRASEYIPQMVEMIKKIQIACPSTIFLTKSLKD